MSVFCTNCGARNEDGKAFCTACGAPIAPAGSRPAQTKAPAANAPASAPAPQRQVPQQSVPRYGKSSYTGHQPGGAVPTRASQGPAGYPQAPGQPYQQAPGQGQSYPPQAQPYPGQGQPYPQTRGQGQPIPPQGQQAAYYGAPPQNGYSAPAIDFERVQPRSKPFAATALIIGVGVLLAAVLLIIWGIAFISPGGLGEDTVISEDETKKPKATEEASPKETKDTPATKAPDDVPPATNAPDTPVQNNRPGQLPSAYTAKVNTSAALESYYGNYTGTMVVYTYDLDKVAEAGGQDKSQVAAFEAMANTEYGVSGEYQGKRITVKAVSFPYANPGDTIIEPLATDPPENGRLVNSQVDSGDGGYKLSNTESIWFLNDGSIYISQAMLCEKDDVFIGGMEIVVLLKPST